MQKDNQFSKALKIDAKHYAPCATRTIPYGRQQIDEDDIQAVVEVLRSDWLTTGPKVDEFEGAFADFVGAKEAVAVSSGTAALHAVLHAVGIGSGDEVILPPMTFVATANAVVFQGGTPVFADVDPDTLLIDPNEVEDKITPLTKAIVAVDYAGHPCDYNALRSIAAKHDLFLVADACHSLGAEYKGRKVGTLADLTVFSFHPVKHITTGEGGMITTDDAGLAERMRLFRNHGITRDPKCFSSLTSDLHPLTSGFSWYYEMEDLGYNYRITDIQCALGISQLQKLPNFLKRRREIAALYDEALAGIPGIEPLGLRSDAMPANQSECLSPYALRPAPCALRSFHAYHLYVVRLILEDLKAGRSIIYSALQSMGIGVNVHYIPVHLHPYYRKTFGHQAGNYPMAEKVYEQLISLPIYPKMNDQDTNRIIETVRKVMEDYVR